MLIIRLQRIGRKNEPSFRLVLTESKNAAKKKAQEVLGSHDFRKTNTILNKDRIIYWISKGAQLSDTAHNLLVSNKIIEGKKRNVLPKKTVAKKDEPAETAPVETPVAA
ncbi:MAG: 30S ribosomal protein S16 [Patescibacteria group bacterium]